MSEQPGATAIINPQPTPIDQMSSEQAAARIEQLKGDPAFAERLGKLDVGARDEWLRLWDRKRGDDLPPPQTPEGVYASMEQQMLAQAETHGNFLRSRGLTDIEIFQIQNGRPVPIEERRFWEAKWEQLKNDRGWYQRWLDRDADAVAEQTRIAHALRMRPGTVAECEQWDRDHPFPVRK